MSARFSNRTSSESSPNSQRVLFVHEGCPDLACCLDALKQLGYDVRTCNNYAGGLRCLECEDFDLVVVCQGSPKFEGRCVLKRAMEINPRMPVLVVARCLDMKCYLDAMGLGAFDYLETPLTASEAVRAMEAHLTAPAAAARARGATDYFG
jgi:DNA-binding NtrC family response regulator